MLGKSSIRMTLRDLCLEEEAVFEFVSVDTAAAEVLGTSLG